MLSYFLCLSNSIKKIGLRYTTQIRLRLRWLYTSVVFGSNPHHGLSHSNRGGLLVSFPAFHLCGPRFESHQEHNRGYHVCSFFLFFFIPTFHHSGPRFEFNYRMGFVYCCCCWWWWFGFFFRFSKSPIFLPISAIINNIIETLRHSVSHVLDLMFNLPNVTQKNL